MSERMSHSIERALHNRGIVTMQESHRPDYWTEKAWENTILQLHESFEVAFVGDSHIYNGDFQSEFTNINIINIGCSGSTVADLLRRIKMLQGINAKKVFIMSGANDLLSDSIQEFIANYENLVKEIKKYMSEPSIYILSILPMNEDAGRKQIDDKDIQCVNDKLNNLCIKDKCLYIDLYACIVENGELPKVYSKDGLHLNQEGYKVIMDALREYVVNK